MKWLVSKKKYDELEKRKEEYRILAEKTVQLNDDILRKYGKTIFEKPIQFPFVEQLHFANPCNMCSDFELDWEIISEQGCFGIKDYIIEIHCKHENVCKKVSNNDENRKQEH